MIKLFLGASLLVFTASSWANMVWECNDAILLDLCRNVTCYQNRPYSSHANHLTISLTNNKNLSICTQSACWRGEVQPSLNSASSHLQLREINWKDPHSSKNNYLLSINPQEKSLFFQGQAGKHPLQCRSV